MTKPRIYLDACPFIDAAKRQIGQLPQGRDTDLQYFKLILEAAKAGELLAFTSTLTVAECLHANGDMSDSVKKTFKALLSSGRYVTLVTPDPFLAEEARDLRWVHGIDLASRGADYLHVASALQMRCSEFVTTDGPIRRKEPQLARLGLRVVTASGTNALTAERRQQPLPGFRQVLSLNTQRRKRRT